MSKRKSLWNTTDDKMSVDMLFVSFNGPTKEMTRGLKKWQVSPKHLLQICSWFSISYEIRTNERQLTSFFYLTLCVYIYTNYKNEQMRDNELVSFTLHCVYIYIQMRDNKLVSCTLHCVCKMRDNKLVSLTLHCVYIYIYKLYKWTNERQWTSFLYLALYIFLPCSFSIYKIIL